jgi:hypothetical protein
MFQSGVIHQYDENLFLDLPVITNTCIDVKVPLVISVLAKMGSYMMKYNLIKDDSCAGSFPKLTGS